MSSLRKFPLLYHYLCYVMTYITLIDMCCLKVLFASNQMLNHLTASSDFTISSLGKLSSDKASFVSFKVVQ